MNDRFQIELVRLKRQINHANSKDLDVWSLRLLNLLAHFIEMCAPNSWTGHSTSAAFHFRAQAKASLSFCLPLNHLQIAREMSKLHIAHGETNPMNLFSMCDFWFKCSCLREPRLTNSNTLQPSLSFLLFFPFFFYVCAKRNNHFLCVNAKWPLHRETLTA